MTRATVDIVSIDDSLEAPALRSALERWDVRVTLHPIGQAKHLVSVLDGSQHLSPIVFLICHGDDRGIILPELMAELEAEQPYHPVVTAADIREFVWLPDGVLINTGCATGTPEFAGACLDAGSHVYIGPTGYPDGAASLFYVFQLCYEWIYKGRQLSEAHARANAPDDQTGLFKLFEKSTARG